VQISIKDVFLIINSAPPAHYDAILLDVDNGPVAMVRDGNDRLYSTRGFNAIQRVLRPRGLVSFWSATQDAAFEKRFSEAGFKVEAVPAKAYPQARRPAHTIYIGDPRSRQQ
jgi:spermidine synthase